MQSGHLTSKRKLVFESEGMFHPAKGTSQKHLYFTVNYSETSETFLVFMILLLFKR